MGLSDGLRSGAWGWGWGGLYRLCCGLSVGLLRAGSAVRASCCVVVCLWGCYCRLSSFRLWGCLSTPPAHQPQPSVVYQASVCGAVYLRRPHISPSPLSSIKLPSVGLSISRPSPSPKGFVGLCPYYPTRLRRR